MDMVTLNVCSIQTSHHLQTQMVRMVLFEGKSGCCWSNFIPKFEFLNIFEYPLCPYALTSMAVKQ
jgi:hypothetical protein